MPQVTTVILTCATTDLHIQIMQCKQKVQHLMKILLKLIYNLNKLLLMELGADKQCTKQSLKTTSYDGIMS